MKMMQMWSNMTQHRLILTVAGVILLALLAVIPLFNSVYLTVLIITILAFVILTVAWTLFSGPTGYVSIASSAFFGIGMYTAAIWGKDLPFTLIILIAAVISALFAIIIGAVTLRLRGIYFTIFTFGLVFLIQQLLTWWEITFTHTRGRFVVSVDNDVIYYHMLIIFLVLFVTTFFLRRSKWGTALKSIGQNEDAATHTGINVTLLKVLVFGLSAFFMGAAGAALATRLNYIDPGAAFNINYSFFPMLMAIFGGMRNLAGPIIGAAIFAYIEEFLTTKFPYYYMLIFGTIMVLVITFLPDGLIGLLQRWRKGGRQKANADS